MREDLRLLEVKDWEIQCDEQRCSEVGAGDQGPQRAVAPVGKVFLTR
jgi:hypothetical protein